MTEDHCLTEWGFVVQARACVSVTASANFEVKGTIDFVFLGAKNLG